MSSFSQASHRAENATLMKLFVTLIRKSVSHWQWHYQTWFAVNVVLAALFMLWLFFDSRFEASVDWWHFQNSDSFAGLSYHMADWWWLRFRNGMLLVFISTIGLAAVIMLQQFVFGNPINRSVRAALCLIAILAMWLSVGTHWQDIVWKGKQFRLQRILTSFEAATETLREQWPKADGELEGLGPFMAYPVGRPRTLLMLTLPQVEKFPGSFSVVEGQPGGPFRFELVAKEEGDWLEWHPDGSFPATFTGGLGDLYRLKKSHPLEDGWHLARYSH